MLLFEAFGIVFDEPHEDAENNNNPAQNAGESFTKLSNGLNAHERNRSPKDNFQCIEDKVSFEARPFLKSLCVLGQKLV